MKAQLLCLTAPVAGILAIAVWRGEPPTWLLQLEVMTFSAAALAFGYTAFAPIAPAWFFARPVKGVICIYLGVGAMFVPSQFIVSAVFIGIGTRLVMAEFRPGIVVTHKPATGLGHEPTELAVRESGPMAPRV